MSYHDYISEATLNYLMQQYPEHTPGWLATFTDEVHRLEEMWGVQVEGYERDSRFGTILYGQSSRYGKVAVKIVPWFSPRLRGEVYCYQHLPYREMCPLYAVDEKLGAMLLKYVTVPETADAARKEAAIAALYFVVGADMGAAWYLLAWSVLTAALAVLLRRWLRRSGSRLLGRLA